MRAWATRLLWLLVAVLGPVTLVGLAQLETSAALNELLVEQPERCDWRLGLCEAGPCLRAPTAGLVAWLRPGTPFLLLAVGAGLLVALALVWRRTWPLALLPTGALGMSLLTFAGVPDQSALRARPVMDGARRVAARMAMAGASGPSPALLGLVHVRTEANRPEVPPRDPVLGWDQRLRVVADRDALRWALLVHWLLCAAGLAWLERRGPRPPELGEGGVE